MIIERFDTKEFIQWFVEKIYYLYNKTNNIIFQKNSQFVFEFWKDLINCLEIALKHFFYFN